MTLPVVDGRHLPSETRLATMASKLRIDGFTLGPWMTNCYVLHTESESACWLIDAGFEPEPMIRAVRDQGLTPRQIVLTHAHVDHIAGLSAIRTAWPDLPILIHEAEAEALADPMQNLSAMLAEPVIAPAATRTLSAGQTLMLGDMPFELRHTPGHSPGGLTLYQPGEAVALSGDALFAGSIGRTDFPGCDHGTLIRSIREQLLTLPDATRVLPGHGPQTTIGAERRSNPFL